MEDPDRWFPPSPPTGVPSALPLPPPIPSTVNFNFNYFITNRSFRIAVPSVLAISMLMIFCCICKKLKACCNYLRAGSASSSTAASLQDNNNSELELEAPSSSRASPPLTPHPLPPGSGIVIYETITTHINGQEIHIVDRSYRS